MVWLLCCAMFVALSEKCGADARGAKDELAQAAAGTQTDQAVVLECSFSKVRMILIIDLAAKTAYERIMMSRVTDGVTHVVQKAGAYPVLDYSNNYITIAGNNGSKYILDRAGLHLSGGGNTETGFCQPWRRQVLSVP